MPYYVAIVEDDGPDRAVGIWFPDLPGCFSAGDDVDHALHNAEEAVALYADSIFQEGKLLPPARTLSELRKEMMLKDEFQNYMVALVPFDVTKADAAE